MPAADSATKDSHRGEKREREAGGKKEEEEGGGGGGEVRRYHGRRHFYARPLSAKITYDLAEW